MGRDLRDEEDRPNGRDRVKKHKKEKHRSREKARDQTRSPEEDRSSRRQDKVGKTEVKGKWLFINATSLVQLVCSELQRHHQLTHHLPDQVWHI